MNESIQTLITDLRIEAEPDLIIDDESMEFSEILKRESVNTDVTFVGLKSPEEDEIKDYAENLFDLATGNSSFIFVRNASQYRGKLIS